MSAGSVTANAIICHYHFRWVRQVLENKFGSPFLTAVVNCDCSHLHFILLPQAYLGALEHLYEKLSPCKA